MTCGATSQIAPVSVASDGQPHPALNVPSDRSELVGNTENGLSNAGLPNIIRNRASRLVFNNDVQRQRFLTIHQTLSARSSNPTHHGATQ